MGIKGRPALASAPDDTIAEDDSTTTGSVMQFTVNKVVIHESYEALTHLHDIAVLRLDGAITWRAKEQEQDRTLFSSSYSAAGKVRRICLPPSSISSLQDTTAVVAGK